MKQIVLGIFFILFSSGAIAQTGKIGFVDVQAVITSMPEYTAAQNTLGSFSQTLVPQNIKDKSKQLDEKYAKYEAEVQTMSDTRKEVAQQEIINLEKEIQELHKTNQTQQKLTAKQNELFAPIETKAAQLIEQVAKENGYSIVFEISQMPLVYADETANMMPMILTKLGGEN